MHLRTFLAGAFAAILVCAHPGGDVQTELAEQRAMLSLMTRTDLSHCAEKIKARGLEARAIARRTELLSELLEKAGKLDARDIDPVLNKSHHSPEHYTLNTPEETLFHSNSSCVLSPEVTEGPFYVAGEFVRKNLIEHERGVEMTVDFQVLDVETCEPVSDVYLEIWSCNATGVYSGMPSHDAANTNSHATFLRGLQKTDHEGVANFHTLFPGHYPGRTTHVHVLVHTNAIEQPNGTVFGTTASHIGMVYFDQALINKVEGNSVYKENKGKLTLNKDDEFLADGAKVGDPIMQYVELGGRMEDGLLAWISFGVNKTLGREIDVAATLTEKRARAIPTWHGNFAEMPAAIPTA